jgi:hypothetical protein
VHFALFRRFHGDSIPYKISCNVCFQSPFCVVLFGVVLLRAGIQQSEIPMDAQIEVYHSSYKFQCGESYNITYSYKSEPGSSVGIVTRLQARLPESRVWFPDRNLFRCLDPPSRLSNWYPGALSLRQSSRFHLVSKVKKDWSYTFIPLYIFLAWCLIKQRDNCTL